MSQQLTTGTFYVYSNNNQQVLARYLTDNNGNFIIDPNPKAGGMPYIVPANYDPNATVSKYAAIAADALQALI